MKNLIALIFSVLIAFSLQAQDKEEANSKIDAFSSKTGVIMKTEDYMLPNLNLAFGAAECRVRKITSGNEVAYFYQITKEDKYGKKTASIAYEDILEMEKALKALNDATAKDKATTSDYMENRFITDDGFEVGYYVKKGNLNWYLKLKKYGSGTTVFPKSLESIETAFQAARSKIEELK